KNCSNITTLNKLWHIWSQRIKEAIIKHIPHIFMVPKTFYSISLKSTKLYSALKNINKALNIIVTKTDTPLDTLNKHISKAAIQANLTIPNISQDEYNNSYDSTTNKLKEYKNIIWQAQNTEKRNEQNEKIKFYTNYRYSDFKDNTTR